MKTKLFLIVCLFAGTTLGQLSAQNNQKNDITKSFVIRGTSEAYVLYVYCDGLQVDEMMVTTPFQNVNHYQKGIWVWCNSWNIGEVTSLMTGEVFRLKDIDRITITDDQNLKGFVVDHVNLFGNNGSHYVASCIYNFPSWEIISIVKASCPGLNK
jgi:hypothetical protein